MSTTPNPSRCAVCNATENLKLCGGCRVIAYCGTEHQIAHRKTHKGLCKYVAAGGNAATYSPANQKVQQHVRRGWANGLPPAQQREWFLDCYRMRVDDEFTWGGGKTRGSMGFAFNGDILALHDDFLAFCLLAVQARALPPSWDWPAFLDLAVGAIHFNFEKSDAQEKYGSENVFASLMGSGRSLRATAETIYGSGIQSFEDSPVHRAVCARIDKWREADEEETLFNDVGRDALFDNIGGQGLWISFLDRLVQFHS